MKRINPEEIWNIIRNHPTVQELLQKKNQCRERDYNQEILP